MEFAFGGFGVDVAIEGRVAAKVDADGNDPNNLLAGDTTKFSGVPHFTQCQAGEAKKSQYLTRL